MLTVCRICLNADENLIQDFCDCKGSVGKAHSQCLLDWILVLCEKQNAYHGINCEICQSPFTSKIVFLRSLDFRMLISKPILSFMTCLIIAILLITKLINVVYSLCQAQQKGFWLSILSGLTILEFLPDPASCYLDSQSLESLNTSIVVYYAMKMKSLSE